MEKQSLSEVEVLVSLDENQVSHLSEIAKQLSAKGLKDIQILESIGVITGKCKPNMLSKMRSISGVSAIELSGKVQIAPPESDVQ